MDAVLLGKILLQVFCCFQVVFLSARTVANLVQQVSSGIGGTIESELMVVLYGIVAHLLNHLHGLRTAHVYFGFKDEIAPCLVESLVVACPDACIFQLADGRSQLLVVVGIKLFIHLFGQLLHLSSCVILCRDSQYARHQQEQERKDDKWPLSHRY